MGQTVKRCFDAFEEWTGMTSATILFDSTVDLFMDDSLFEKVKSKKNIAIIATTTDGDVFGGFYSVAVTEQEKEFRDRDVFIFSFESHGRCETPQMFVLKKEMEDDAGVEFRKDNTYGRFVVFWAGYGRFFLGNEKSLTYCTGLSRGFQGIEDTTLTGVEREEFTCCRIVAIQLK